MIDGKHRQRIVAALEHQPVVRLLYREDVELDLQRGVVRGQARQHAWEHRVPQRGRGAHPERAVRAFAQPRNHMVEIAYALVDMLDFLEQYARLAGRDDAATGAVEQAELEAVFHMREHAAEAGLRGAQHLGGAADGLGDHHRAEDFDLSDRQHGSG